MPIPSLFNGSSKSSDTPKSTRPPSYTSERLPQYNFDGAPAPVTAPAAAAALRIPLTAIDEAPEIRVAKKKTLVATIGVSTLILIYIIMNGLVFGCTWFIMAIKLRPWDYSWWAERREKYLLALWIPSVLLAIFSGFCTLCAGAAVCSSKKAWKRRSVAGFFIGLFFFVLTFTPFIGSIAIPMAIRVNYFRHVCDGMDTRIEIDANRISPYNFRPHAIIRDQISTPYKYPLAVTTDGSPISTFNLDLTREELDYRRYYDTYNGQPALQVNSETYEPHGLNYSTIFYNWTAGTWTTVAANRTVGLTGRFFEVGDALLAPELGLYIPDWARVKRYDVYDAFVRIFSVRGIPPDNSTALPASLSDVFSAYKSQDFRSNNGVVARIASFADKKNTVEMCALRRNSTELGTKGDMGVARAGLGDLVPVLVALMQGMRENEWKAGRRQVKGTQVI